MQTKYNYIYENLEKVLPSKPWLKAYTNIVSGGKTPSLPKLASNMLVYGLYLFENKGTSLKDPYEQSVLAESMSACNAFLGIYQSLEKSNQGKYLKRFESSFFQPNDLRAINFELFMYFYLSSQGHSVEIKDDDKNGDTYDYLAKTKDNAYIQIECKSFAYDKGLYVSGEEASDLYSLILNQPHGLDIQTDNQIDVYTIELEQAIPKNKKTRDLMITDIISCLNNPQATVDSKINIYHEVHENVDNISEVDSHLDLTIGKHGVEIARIASTPNGSKGRFCLIITTHAKKSLLREFENICKRSAKEQLPNSKPSSITVEVSNPEVFNYLKNSPEFENKINNIFKQKHLVSLLIFTNTQGSIASDGTHFYSSPVVKEFINNGSSFYGTAGIKLL